MGGSWLASALALCVSLSLPFSRIAAGIQSIRCVKTRSLLVHGFPVER